MKGRKQSWKNWTLNFQAALRRNMQSATSFFWHHHITLHWHLADAISQSDLRFEGQSSYSVGTNITFNQVRNKEKRHGQKLARRWGSLRSWETWLLLFLFLLCYWLCCHVFIQKWSSKAIQALFCIYQVWCECSISSEKKNLINNNSFSFSLPWTGVKNE